MVAETINHAYKNPPNSTEQILHPDKYFAAELPMRVAEVAPVEGNWTKTWVHNMENLYLICYQLI